VFPGNRRRYSVCTRRHLHRWYGGGIVAMDITERIPVEMRWRLSARTLTYLPFAYEKVLGGDMGEEYSVKVGEIFRELAWEMIPIARAYLLPTGNAADLARAVEVLFSALFGPGFEGEPLEASDNRAVWRLTRCPFVSMARELGFNPAHAYVACNAFKNALVEDLNNEYRSSLLWTLCLGDTVCEMTIERKED
jgi:predicted ArsR family transcriptional regulator